MEAASMIAERTNESAPMRPAGFFAARWRGDVPLDRLFWRDMVVVGSLINLAATAAALLLLDVKVPLATALAVHLVPLPYNIFLLLSVWRTADANGGAFAPIAKAGAAIWLALATLL
jgi:hypothetical protein